MHKRERIAHKRINQPLKLAGWAVQDCVNFGYEVTAGVVMQEFSELSGYLFIFYQLENLLNRECRVVA